ncbi:hypothetical protein HELRODRAFT_94890 [Helobdella robusta]|uniref:Neurotransmitter-gated ion-channel ligand-binding domain-containing protein n=1 Tax=Helobdella robusta TaxID=6412 RepID=T1G937_HELRO|nr:hypothetical protein HELRODRAFT_94890 [Helobdella robusta]ESN98755.1 hypothetical protein HELRODRAFT_94890 [Helobdella robusta]
MEQELLRRLLHDYDVDARGVLDVLDPVVVKIQLLLLRIHGLDERSQVLTTTGLIICDWDDGRLKWNSSEYEGIRDIVIKPERVWLPELALMNGADELSPDFRKIRILVQHDGHVHWEPGGVFTTTCDIDIRYFPFDDQSCPIQLGAWAYYSSRMNMTNASSEVLTHDFRLNGEWDIYHTKVEWKENVLPCCPNTRYPFVEFTLFLKRRHMFYVMNIILPCTLLSILVMVVFCLPPDAGEKISLGISVLLAFTVFLLMVAENVPRTSLHTPIIVIYLTCTMALGTLSVCLTVVILNLHHRDAERPVPKLLRLLVLHWLATIMRVHARKPKTMARNRLRDISSPNELSTSLENGLRQVLNNQNPVLSSKINGQLEDEQLDVENLGRRPFRENRSKPSRTDLTHEWKEVAHVLDSLFFVIIFTSMTASAMIILLVPAYKHDPVI